MAEAALTVEVEQIEQVADRRAVHRHVGVDAASDRVREVVAAALRSPAANSSYAR